MLTAQKSLWFENIFALYNRNLIRRRFHSLKVFRLSAFAERNNDLPLIIYINHSSWWDGLIAFEISHKIKLHSYFMMDEKQLKELFLFRRLGAFSIVKDKPRKAMESLDYIAEIFKQNPKSVLWIFPQGEILPSDLRPLHFYKGLSKIIKKFDGNIQLLPMAFCYEFTGEYKPEIFVKIGKIENSVSDSIFEPKKFTQNLTENLTNILDELNLDIACQNFVNFDRLI